MFDLICMFVFGLLVGAVAAFLVAWYWIRKYGEKIEQKVRDTYEDYKDTTSLTIKDFVQDLITRLKNQ